MRSCRTRAPQRAVLHKSARPHVQSEGRLGERRTSKSECAVAESDCTCAGSSANALSSDRPAASAPVQQAVIRAHAVRSCRRGAAAQPATGARMEWHPTAPGGGADCRADNGRTRACARVCLFVRGTVRRRLHDAVVRADHAKPGTKRPPHLQQQGHATCNKYTESSGQRAALQRTTCNIQHGEVGAQRPSHRDIARRLRHNRKPALALQDHKQPPARTHLLRHGLPCASAAAGGAPTRCMRPSPLRQNPARVRVQRVPAAAAQSGCHNRA